MKKHRFGLALGALLLILVLLLALAPVALAATGEDTTTSSLYQVWALLASAAIPFVTGLLVRKSWAWWWKALIAAGLAVAVGAVSAYFAGAWSGDVWKFILACYAVSSGVFVTVVSNVPGLKEKLYATFNKDPV